MTLNEDALSENSSNNDIAIRDIPKRRKNIINEFVELPMFLINLAISLSATPISNIILYRTCLHALNHTETECQIFLSLEKNNVTQDLEKEVQGYATFVSTVQSIIQALAPAIMSLFIVVWSDTHGRKPLLVWPILGMTLSSMLAVVYSMLNNLGPWWYILVIVPYSLSGGFNMLFTGAFCYVSDVTSNEERSLRMTILEASVSLGTVVGLIMTSYILKAVGNVYLLLIAAVLNVIAYVYANISLRESITGAIQGGISTVLDFLLVKEMFRECFKRRPNYGRAQIIFLTIANSLTIFTMYGLLNLEYLYTREKLHWNIKEYTWYSASNTMMSFVGSFMGVVIIQRLFNIGDLAFSNIAIISSGIEYAIKAFSVLTWHLYFAAAISLFKDLSAPLIRSLVSKILPIEDVAKVFALMSIIEGLCPLIAPAMYNIIYECTLSNFSGAVYLLSAGITVICAILLGFVQYFRRNVSSPYQYEVIEST